MSRLKWDQAGEKLYETGVSNAALYPMEDGSYPAGYVWNGISSISENPTGGEPNPIYADNIKYLNLVGIEELEGTIEAYMYPDEFKACDGSEEIVPGITIGQQNRKLFGLAFKTILGNDEKLNAYSYKLHLIYGMLAAPSEKNYETVNDNPDASSMSWDYSTTPVRYGDKSTANITIDAHTVAATHAAELAVLDAILFGADADEFSASKTYKVGDLVMNDDVLYCCKTAVSTPAAFDDDDWIEIETPGPRLPLPDEIASIFGATV